MALGFNRSITARITQIARITTCMALLLTCATSASAQTPWRDPDQEPAQDYSRDDRRDYGRDDRRDYDRRDAGRDPGQSVDYSEFHQRLEPYGEWTRHPRFGSVWVPRANQDRDWRPYSRGQWIFTDEHGWYWRSDEEWGWATYHYGRWRLDDRMGWVWIPGHEWGPAWVAWRYGDESVGWAPLPPEAVWDPYTQSYASFDSFDSPRMAPYWIFVPPMFLTAVAVHRHFYPRSRNEFYFRETRHVTRYESRNRQIFNRGVDIGWLQNRTGRPISAHPLRGIDERGHIGGQVGIYRPQFTGLPRSGQGPGVPGRPGPGPGDARFAPGPSSGAGPQRGPAAAPPQRASAPQSAPAPAAIQRAPSPAAAPAAIPQAAPSRAASPPAQPTSQPRPQPSAGVPPAGQGAPAQKRPQPKPGDPPPRPPG